MPYETGLLVGSISIVTACIAKLKCFIKKNGTINWGCGFTDAPLIDTDDQVVETTQLGDVKVLYVRNKHHNHESDNE